MDKRKEYVIKERIRNMTKAKYVKKHICSACGFKGYTEWHHIIYIVDTVIELCRQCHSGSNEQGHKQLNNKKIMMENYLKILECT